MSRIAKLPIVVPKEVKVVLNYPIIHITGSFDSLSYKIHKYVNVQYESNVLVFKTQVDDSKSWAQAGTTRSIIYSMIVGVSTGFIKKLKLSGVGYRISLSKKNIINMSLGYSHNVEYILPKGVLAESPSTTEIILKSANKQLVGQVASNLRSYRIPEPYKGKGIRYEHEKVRIKEAKKK
ncbi:50S ribosomal protein L6 [Buchnera aphidicola]|uniref:50S ribosomal protein L6 n=1 Tax=Buchnera aphidicola (Anoecia oenotherae) TaxID=1241833 RepID=A0A4D6XZR7_9GAMM|nr:50S ribosomal protein L6 [Buchnera aphidicola]QCI19510.1 50S ribosomal protein L6 [Buchnera aphidicola (Anoecia oenotherae)]